MQMIPDHTSTADFAGELEPIGPIVRLQIQTAPLKQGEKPHRWYDPAPIRSVPELVIDEGGVTGLDGDRIADVHHRDNPNRKFRGDNGVSIGFTGHYARMRERFGEHLAGGIAGESILVDSDRVWAESDLAAGIVIVGDHPPVVLEGIVVAAPCVEFSRFCALYAHDQRSDQVITATLRFLDEGMRGFYASLADGSGEARIAVGDMVSLRLR